MSPSKKIYVFSLAGFLLAMAAFSSLLTGCAYGFSSTNPLNDTLKTVRVNLIENRAPYINPQLSPNLTERLKQKIVRQTKLTQVNGDNAQLDIRGMITDYSVTTTGITNANGRSQTSINRLTVTVHITSLMTQGDKPPAEFDVSRSFDFAANLTLQSAEAQLLDEMVRNLTDEIFNRLFSDW